MVGHKIFGRGNLKLSRKIATFSICPASQCPSEKLGLCPIKTLDGKCYAQADEQRFPYYRTFLNKQRVFWQSCYAVPAFGNLVMMERYIKDIGLDCSIFRCNVAGDFGYDYEVKTMARFVRSLSRLGIKSYCYTARRDLDLSPLRRAGMVVNGAGFKATNEYRVLPAARIPKNARYVCPGLCGPEPDRCDWCWTLRDRVIFAPLRKR
jgi:hypothetical protein